MPQALWLAPHRLVAERVRGQLVASGIDAALSPGIKTLTRCADAMVSLDPTAPSILPRAATRWLLDQAISALHAAGKLEVMAEVAGRPGLLDAVEQMIGELKARGVTASKFATWARSGRRRPRDRELAGIYTAYGERLEKLRAADRFDITRLAVEGVEGSSAAEEGRHRVVSYDLVVVDGFASFGYYERQLLTRLVGNSRQAWIALTSIDRQGRNELTSTARQTLDWCQSEWPGAIVETVEPAKRKQTAAIAHLADTVFLPPTDGIVLPKTVAGTLDHVQVIAAADAYDEAAEVARRIKSLLVEGVPAAEIVVAVPHFAAHHHRLEEVFGTYGIPASFDAPSLVGDDPTVRALAGLLALEAEDWSFRLVVATVSNHLLTALDGGAVEPPWRTAHGAAEWLVRELQIPAGRKGLVEQVERLASTTADERGRTSRLPLAAVAAKPIFGTLAAALDSLPKTASPLEWTRASEELAAGIGLRLDGETNEAWRQVGDATAWLEHAAAGDRPASLQWTLAEWLAQLSEWMPLLPSSARLNEEGCVRVYGAGAARYAPARCLFVVGLDERSFSTAATTGGLYSEKQYDELVAADSSGRAWQATPTHERTMQLFFDVVRQARESLTFSFAALDSSGQAEPASPLLAEACRTLGDDFASQLDATPTISALPREHQLPSSLRDWRLLAVHQADHNKPQLLGGLLGSDLAKPTSDALAAGLVAMHHRARGDSFGPMEGILSSGAARAWCARQFGEGHQWSTSQLERYAFCPFQFLMNSVLKIEPLGDIALETDYSRRGTLLHRALAELHTRLGNGVRQPSEHDADQFCATLIESILTVRGEFAEFGVEGA